MKRFWLILALVALAFFSFLLIRISVQYRVMHSNVAFLHLKQRAYYIRFWRISFYTHVFSSWLVLLAGFTQFSPWLLRRRPAVHRIMGWIYLVVVLIISGPAAFVMALYANGGLAGRISFTLLAGLWLVFTFLAGYFVIRRQFARHGAFMYLSYALTLSAITLRGYEWLIFRFHPHVSVRDVYALTAWLSWVPNLIVALILVRKRRFVNAGPASLSSQISHRRQSERLEAAKAPEA